MVCASPIYNRTRMPTLDFTLPRTPPANDDGPATDPQFLARALYYISLTLIVTPPLVLLMLFALGPEIYAQFARPNAILLLITGGIGALVLGRLNRPRAAWFVMVISAIGCGFLIGLSDVGYTPTHSMAIYLVASFLAVITLPRHGWRLIIMLCVGALIVGGLWRIGLFSTTITSSTNYGQLVINLTIFTLGVSIIALTHQHLSEIVEQLQRANELLETANSELKRSQSKSRVLMETGLDPFFLLNQQGHIVEANQQTYDLFGYQEAELLQLHVDQIVPNAVQAQLDWTFQMMRKRDLKPLRTQLVHKSGKTIDGEVFGRLVQLDGQELMYVAARDITHQVEQEREIREKGDLLEMITQNLPVRIAYFDRNATLSFHNRAFAEAYRPKTAQGPVNGAALVRATDGYQRYPYVQRVFKGETVQFELDEVLEDGSRHYIQKVYVPHFAGNEVIGRVSLGIDITELRRTQKSLEAKNALFNLVLDSMPARISYIHRNGDILFVNERVYDHFNVRPEDAVKMKVRDLLPTEYQAAITPYVRQAFAQPNELMFETPLTLPNGKTIIERSYYYPHVQNGVVDAVLTLHIDVTTARATENALAQAQKLESLGVLAGGIAHDFNNLLAAILGQASVALFKLANEHPARRHVVQSVKAAKRASSLTQQMLAYSGRGSFAIGPLDINQLIEGNLTLFEVSIPKNIRLLTDLSPTLPLIEADTAQLQQLIMNLIINAGQAIGTADGQIALRTSVLDIASDQGEFWEITGDRLIAGRYVSIQVQDNGCGMDAETVREIFDPFYTTKPSGTGLGLAAALGIIRGHKGGIQVHSEVGKGTTFHLLFPIIVGEQEAVADTPFSAEFPTPSRHTILVIDDEPDILDVVSDMLDLNDIDTLQATNGHDGIDLYKQHRDQISVVLLDLMMPGLSGADTFIALREIDPTVKVILSSGYSEVEATRHFVGRGLADFVQKPYDIQTLLGCISAVIEQT